MRDVSGRLALCVPARNAAAHLPRLLETARLQPVPFDEVLVFDDASDDGTDAEIKAFCQSKYDVTFPLFAKLSTLPGPDQSPIYARLQHETGKVPSWNFCKYLVGKDGKVIGFWNSKTTPDSPDLRTAIETALAAK